jgi:3-methyladenine DNA glycosylase Tag
MTERVRCDWALGVSEAYTACHDHQWGTPTHDDQKLFGFLVYAYTQAMGLVNDHLLGCYRHRACLAAAR